MSSHIKTRTPTPGFTLIELLIVVAIIAILAAIAVPNFLEAQTRAKVSRAKADLRTIATGLESYVIDQNKYPPNDGVYNVTPIQLTTPIAYLSSATFVDPFMDKERIVIPGVDPELARLYTYTRILTEPDYNLILSQGGPAQPVESIDSAVYNLGAMERYGPWRLVSCGPDRIYKRQFPPVTTDDFNLHNNALFGSDVPYDPTNGTVSFGNVLLTQKRARSSF